MKHSTFERVQVIDSHTAGEPTRTIIAGGPDLGAGPLAERLERFRQRHDGFRSAILDEPRGSEVLVGAMLVMPHDSNCAAGVIFFNNVGFLGMCGHGAIGVAVTLAHLGRITPGRHWLETPVGIVEVLLEGGNQATIANVPSYRHLQKVAVKVPELGTIHGDVAWGGNWFFLVEDHGKKLDGARVEELTEVCWRIRQALQTAGITGANGAEIDHIELFGPPTLAGADSKNFVLCPGKVYDRSPCGTGTSAKMACLAADGKLGEGQVWRQESIIATAFEGWIKHVEGRIQPYIRGSAYITAEATLLYDQADTLRISHRMGDRV